MVEIKQMSIKRRKALIDRINEVMENEFGIEQESINGFWGVFMAGAEKIEMA